MRALLGYNGRERQKSALFCQAPESGFFHRRTAPRLERWIDI